MLSRPRLTTHALHSRKHLQACESPYERRVRIKKENGMPQDELDSIYAEIEQEKRIAGRYEVNCISVGETVVEVIEFLSDAEDDQCADDEGTESEASTLDLEKSPKHAPDEPCLTSVLGGLRLPAVTVDLTTAKVPIDGLLHEYESLYVDLAQSSSSDDYESTDEEDEDNSNDDDQASANDADADANDTGSEQEMPRALLRRRRQKLRVPRPPPLEQQVLMRKIRHDIERLEQHKPWRFVYRCLKLPFTATPRTDSYGFIFERWDNFWTKHGRAVWERMFWKPLTDGTHESNQRKYRQSKAASTFCELAAELKMRFGLELMKEVKGDTHPGWWYRPRRPINVLRLRCRELKLYELHLSRYRERWPCGRRFVRENTDAMWCFRKEPEPEAETQS